MRDAKPKRRTWRDRKYGTVGITLDCVLLGGSRWLTTNDPFNDKGTAPAHVAQLTVRTLALLYGVDEIEAACARGIGEARKGTKKARNVKTPRTASASESEEK